MIRRPPRSTLFPTRRSSDLRAAGPLAGPCDRAPAHGERVRDGAVLLPAHVRPPGYHDGPAGRSEEHTSELQSHLNLVCRLLLEKKKTMTSMMRHPIITHCES